MPTTLRPPTRECARRKCPEQRASLTSSSANWKTNCITRAIDLQTTIEELETSNEEFKAANEEVTSINEELQSTNEELETSKEELQSLNEELSTVNNQLEQKVGELEVDEQRPDQPALQHGHCHHLSGPPVLHQAIHTRHDAVVATDPHRHRPPHQRHYPEIHRRRPVVRCGTGARALVPIAKEVRTDEGEWYIRRIVPYRTEDNRIDGTVVTFTDISDRSEIGTAHAGGAAAMPRESSRRCGTRWWFSTSDLRVQSCNRAFYDTFRLSPEDAQGQLFYELGNRQWDIPALRTLLEDILPQAGRPQPDSETLHCSNAVVDYEVDLDFDDIGRRTMLLNARAIECDQEPTELILLAIEDITERKRAEEELRQLNETLEERVAERALSHARLASLVASTADAVIALDLEGRITDWNAGAERLFGYSERRGDRQGHRPADSARPPQRIPTGRRAAAAR